MSDNPHDKTLTGSQFSNIVLKNFDEEFVKEYYAADINAEPANVRAQREAEERKPNGYPRAASIIPVRYTYGRWIQSQNIGLAKNLVIPTYIIDSNVWIGNTYGEDIKTLEIDYPIIIRNCVFKRSVNIQNINCKYNISFSNCVFEDVIVLDNVEAKSITFDYSYESESNLKIVNCKLSNLVIRSCKINTCRISSNQILEKLTIFDANITELTLVNNESFYTDILALSSEIIETDLADKIFQFSNDVVKIKSSLLVVKNNLLLNNIILNFSEKFDKSKITIRSLKVGSLTLTGILAGKSALLKDITASNLEMIDFTNNAQFIIQNFRIEATGYCLIKNSTLGTTMLTNVDLRNTRYISVTGSNLLSITLINTFLPDNIIGNTEHDHLGQQEAYKQLKQLYNKQSDKFKEMDASRRELESYSRSLTYEENFFDKSVLLLNKLSNNYGFDVKQGFWSVIVSSTIFYMGYCWFLGYCLGFDYKLFVKLFSYFLEFVNPLHKADFIPNDLLVKVNPGARIWEGFSRIFISYFLYQFIQAFRKYGK